MEIVVTVRVPDIVEVDTVDIIVDYYFADDPIKVQPYRFEAG